MWAGGDGGRAVLPAFGTFLWLGGCTQASSAPHLLHAAPCRSHCLSCMHLSRACVWDPAFLLRTGSASQNLSLSEPWCGRRDHGDVAAGDALPDAGLPPLSARHRGVPRPGAPLTSSVQHAFLQPQSCAGCLPEHVARGAEHRRWPASWHMQMPCRAAALRSSRQLQGC